MSSPRCICGRRLRGRQRYCSAACRQAAYRRRRSGAIERGLVTLCEADARLFLSRIPDSQVDLVLTDPPYRFDRRSTDLAFREWFPELADDAWPEVLAELYRVLRRGRTAFLFCDRRTEPIFRAAAASAGFRVRDPLVWDKGSIGPGHPTWRSRYELILWLEKGRGRVLTRFSQGNVLTYSRRRGGYPAEKPLALLRLLIAGGSLPGEVVCDPFCGSGNVGKAARELRRRAVLCDVEASFAAARLRNAIAPLERPDALRPALRSEPVLAAAGAA